MKLLMTLPGVSQHTAQPLLAAIGDISRFPNADKLAGYLGLVPSTGQSANRCYHGPFAAFPDDPGGWRRGHPC